MSDVQQKAIAIACHATLGGSSAVATHIAVGLGRRGRAVHLLAAREPFHLEGDEAVLFHRVDARPYPVFEQTPYTVPLANKLIELVTRHGVGLVNVHYALPHAASALLARTVLGRHAFAWVVSLHGSDVSPLGEDAAYHAVTKKALHTSDMVTVPSEALKKRALAVFDLDPARVKVMPNFVDTERFAPQTPQPHLLDRFFAASAADFPTFVHVSNFRPIKRVDDVIESFARLRTTHAARLLLVGDGPQRAPALMRALELGLEGFVASLGDSHDLNAILPHCTALLLPSAYESFGLAALEALACGIPVIGSDVGGLPDVVTHEVTGFLEPLGDVEALSRRMAQLLADASLQKHLGQAARADVLRRFDSNEAIDNWKALFDNLQTYG